MPDSVPPHPVITARSLFRPPSEDLRFLPEGPRLLQRPPQPGAPLLGWVAIQHGATSRQGSINILNLQTGENRTIPVPGRPGFFAETAQPGLVVAGIERSLQLIDLNTGAVVRTLATLPDSPTAAEEIINDGLAVPGGILFGSKHLNFSQPIAGLYFWDAGTGELRLLAPGQTCSNGKAVLPDGSHWTIIDIDSQPQTITRYQADLNFHSLRRQGLIVPSPHLTLPGFPDGMRPVAGSNSVLVAFYQPEARPAGLAQQLDLDTGAVLCQWELPGSPRVTCPEIVELQPGQVQVIFTTAVEGMPDEMRHAIAPAAGELFIAPAPQGWSVPPPPPLLPALA